MEIVTKVMEKSCKFVGKNVYEPCRCEYTKYYYIAIYIYIYIRGGHRLFFLI